MKSSLEILKKIKAIHKNVEIWTNEIDKATILLADKLRKKYSYLLLDRDGSNGYSWKQYNLNIEMQMLLRSMIGVDKVFRIPRGEKREGSYPAPREYYLTMKHGLKYPREWGSCYFLPSGTAQNVIPKFRLGTLNSEYSVIDFSVLIDNKSINQKKLRKFFIFLSAILKLYKEFRGLEEYLADPNRLGEKNLNIAKSIGRLSDRSDIPDFEKVLKIESKLKKYYPTYVEKLDVFKENQDNLLEKLKEYNHPFRVFLKLKS